MRVTFKIVYKYK